MSNILLRQYANMVAEQMDDSHRSETTRGRAADQAGADFERRILNVYNLLGFTVEPDINLNSSQTASVDI